MGDAMPEGRDDARNRAQRLWIYCLLINGPGYRRRLGDLEYADPNTHGIAGSRSRIKYNVHERVRLSWPRKLKRCYAAENGESTGMLQ